jgi:hypothetical protein
MNRRLYSGESETDDIVEAQQQVELVFSLSLCPYRSGDRDGLPDLVIIVPLFDKSGIT